MDIAGILVIVTKRWDVVFKSGEVVFETNNPEHTTSYFVGALNVTSNTGT
jgi:hypothetical protein